MERWRYCPQCDREARFVVENRTEDHTIRGEKIRVDLPVLVCSVCGVELFDEELTGSALRAAYDEVRRRKGMPSPEELKEVRSRMGLSQRQLGKLLGWSHITIHRYENGGLPNEAHATVLESLMRDHGYALRLLEKNASNFTLEELAELRSKLNRYLGTGQDYGAGMGPVPAPDLARGNRPFSKTKLGGMIGLFAQSVPDLFKTKLFKLLWYADFLHFKRYGRSISGLSYVHLNWGPVPTDYNRLLSELEQHGMIRVEPVVTGDYNGEVVAALGGVALDSLSDEEKDTVRAVTDRFKSWSSKDLSEYSHEEKGYTATGHGEAISYDFAKDLSLD
ncbi:MAG: DUF4065 domain-containing protein [Thermoanaerobacterales bacterium]|nr:DUF4065 domain-containing protein [Thermoanaerobacterales bacterium]